MRQIRRMRKEGQSKGRRLPKWLAMQKQHDPANLFGLLPCARDPLAAFGSNAIDRLQFGVDHSENLGSEPHDQILCQYRANPLDQAAAEVSSASASASTISSMP